MDAAATPPRVFISYARADGEGLAKDLRARLEDNGIPLWQDRANLEGGRDWWLQITAALDRVDFLVWLMTPAAIRSAVVRKEWRYARQQGVTVYPVKGAPSIKARTNLARDVAHAAAKNCRSRRATIRVRSQPDRRCPPVKTSAGRGKSGLRRAGCWVTPSRNKAIARAVDEGEEQGHRDESPRPGVTPGPERVKRGNLHPEQHQVSGRKLHSQAARQVRG